MSEAIQSPRRLLTLTEAARRVGMPVARARYLVREHGRDVPHFIAKTHRRPAKLFDDAGLAALIDLFLEHGVAGEGKPW